MPNFYRDSTPSSRGSYDNDSDYVNKYTTSASRSRYPSRSHRRTSRSHGEGKGKQRESEHNAMIEMLANLTRPDRDDYYAEVLRMEGFRGFQSTLKLVEGSRSDIYDLEITISPVWITKTQDRKATIALPLADKRVASEVMEVMLNVDRWPFLFLNVSDKDTRRLWSPSDNVEFAKTSRARLAFSDWLGGHIFGQQIPRNQTVPFAVERKGQLIRPLESLSKSSGSKFKHWPFKRRAGRHDDKADKATVEVAETVYGDIEGTVRKSVNEDATTMFDYLVLYEVHFRSEPSCKKTSGSRVLKWVIDMGYGEPWMWPNRHA